MKNLQIDYRISCNFIKKETLTQVFSSEYCEIVKSSFFIEHRRWLLLRQDFAHIIKIYKRVHRETGTLKN